MTGATTDLFTNPSRFTLLATIHARKIIGNTSLHMSVHNRSPNECPPTGKHLASGSQAKDGWQIRPFGKKKAEAFMLFLFTGACSCCVGAVLSMRAMRMKISAISFCIQNYSTENWRNEQWTNQRDFLRPFLPRIYIAIRLWNNYSIVIRAFDIFVEAEKLRTIALPSSLWEKVASSRHGVDDEDEFDVKKCIRF